MPDLAEIQRFVDGLLAVDRFAGLDDPSGLLRPAARPIRRLGLALDGDGEIAGWLAAGQFDALLVHRPWDVPIASFPELGVLAYHLHFDERLTTGFNPWLADALGLRAVEPLGAKQGRPLGMIGGVAPQPLATFIARLAAEFGPLAGVRPGGSDVVERVAVVGAMWPELVEQANRRGADLYVTGTWRPRAADAVAAAGLAVALVGHRPPEAWGMRTLAGLIARRWPELAVEVRPEPALA